jgi:hypothetical protein
MKSTRRDSGLLEQSDATEFSITSRLLKTQLLEPADRPRSARGNGKPMRPQFMVVACCALIFISGCATDTASMPLGELEAKLKATLSLKAVSLAARPEGGYAGTGQASDGTNYTITVDQKEAGRLLWYTATSDKGELKAGGFQHFGPSWLRPLTQVRSGIKVILILFVLIGGGFVVVRKLSRRSNRANI